MPREVTIPARTVLEEIFSIVDSPPTKHLTGHIGIGTMVDGVFTPKVPQKFEEFCIQDAVYDEFIAIAGLSYVDADLWPFIDRIRTNTLELRPSDNYDWDGVTGSWVPNLVKAKRKRKKEVSDLQLESSFTEIAFAGSIYDADQVARNNVLGKLAELNARDALALPQTNLVWRDFHNVTRTFASLAGFRNFLNGLTVAIVTRNTNNYLNSWEHKAAIDALLDVPSVESYIITTGWNA